MYIALHSVMFSDSDREINFMAHSSSSVRFGPSDCSVRVRLSNSLGSFGSVRFYSKEKFEFGVFGFGSVRFPSLLPSGLCDVD